MANHKIIQRFKDSERRIALLALAVTRKGGHDIDCLSAEELACLVDGRCTTSERETFHVHLADCELCYQRWIELTQVSELTSNSGKNKKTGRLIQFRHFAWTGSFLAAAASVVVFLNISREVPLPKHDVNFQQTVQERKVNHAEFAGEELHAQAKTVLADTEISARADVTKKKMVNETKRRGATTKERSTEVGPVSGVRQRVQPKSMRENIVQQKAAFSPAVVPVEIASNEQPPVDTWIKDIQEKCQAGEVNASYWHNQYLTGQAVSHFSSTAEKQLVQNILPLITALQKSTVGTNEICLKIVAKIERLNAQRTISQEKKY